MILDLMELNKYVKYQHFKMFSLQTALELVKNNSWLASIDLKDANYSVPIHSCTEREWVSNVFVRPKPGGEFRMILDLMELNKYVKMHCPQILV